MSTTRILAALVALWLVTPTATAAADCVDPYACICRGGQVIVVGVVTAPERLRVERVAVSPSFQGTTTLSVGAEASTLNVPPGTPAGTRVLGSAGFSSSKVLFEKQLDGTGVTCSGASFSEAEVVDLAFAGYTTCRERAADRIGSSDCNDYRSCGVSKTGAPDASSATTIGVLFAAIGLVRWRRSNVRSGAPRVRGRLGACGRAERRPR